MVQIENISLRLNGQFLYKDLSVQVPAGGRLLIRGESGSGKSTLLRMLLGFVKPDTGKVFIDGQRLTLENVWQLRLKMAYVSQEMQIGRGGVEAFIREIFRYKNNRLLNYSRDQVLGLMNDFQLNRSTIEKDLDELSGGELQRLAIIVTLLLDRQIYLLDEVTSALDQPLKELIADYFASLKNKTLIIASHDNVWHQRQFTILNIGKNGSSS